jgi:hypothetical protein
MEQVAVHPVATDAPHKKTAAEDDIAAGMKRL